ncbi:MAG: Hsp20 family protein [archaeon]
MENELVQSEIIKVAPEVCSYASDDESKMYVEIAIPGVKKESISLKLQEDFLYLNATRSDKDIEYVASLSLCCPVDPNKAHAKYEDGLLKIDVAFKDAIDDAIKIDVM